MTSISHQEAERYLSRPDPDHFLYLVFGGDQGLVFERSRRLSRGASDGDNGGVTELGGDAVAADPLLLADEANAIGLFGGTRRVIRILAGAKSILPALDLLATAPPTDCTIIIEAGDLKRDALLRKWIEKQTFAAAIECRADDARDVQRLIDSELRSAGLSITPDAREALGAMLGEDRLSTRSELGKLILYAQGRGAITLDDINAILHDASTLNIDAAISAVFSGRTEQTIEALNRALRTGVDAQMLLASALRYATALHRQRAEIDNGGSFDDNLQSVLRQFAGYGRKAEIASHLRSIPLARLETFISALSLAIKTARQSNILVEQRVMRVFLAIAAGLRRG